MNTGHRYNLHTNQERNYYNGFQNNVYVDRVHYKMIQYSYNIGIHKIKTRRTTEIRK